VEHGVSGYLCRDTDAMVEAVGRVGELSRAACRRRFESHFSDRVVVDAYERLYLDLVER
jgi:glycosyltransferase involved in cell wall biosynthesis